MLRANFYYESGNLVASRLSCPYASGSALRLLIGSQDPSSAWHSPAQFDRDRLAIHPVGCPADDDLQHRALFGRTYYGRTPN